MLTEELENAYKLTRQLAPVFIPDMGKERCADVVEVYQNLNSDQKTEAPV